MKAWSEMTTEERAEVARRGNAVLLLPLASDGAGATTDQPEHVLDRVRRLEERVREVEARTAPDPRIGRLCRVRIEGTAGFVATVEDVERGGMLLLRDSRWSMECVPYRAHSSSVEWLDDPPPGDTLAASPANDESDRARAILLAALDHGCQPSHCTLIEAAIRAARIARDAFGHGDTPPAVADQPGVAPFTRAERKALSTAIHMARNDGRITDDHCTKLETLVDSRSADRASGEPPVPSPPALRRVHVSVEGASGWNGTIVRWSGSHALVRRDDDGAELLVATHYIDRWDGQPRYP